MPFFKTPNNAPKQPVLLTAKAARLFWTFNGPMETSIWVNPKEYNPDSAREAYFRQTVGGASWHPISQSPLTDPKVSSMTVVVYDLELWEDNWLELHGGHSFPGDDGCEFGPLPEYNPNEDEEGPDHLLKCCGTERPRNKAAKLVVKASNSDFITVHDYVCAVHIWLMGLRDSILAAMGIWDSRPVPGETKLVVNYDAPEHLMVEREESFLDSRRRSPNFQLQLGQPGSAFAPPSGNPFGFAATIGGPHFGEDVLNQLRRQGLYTPRSPGS